MAILGLAALPVVMVSAACDGSPVECIQQGTDDVSAKKGSDQDLTNGIKTVVNVLLFILGAIAVIMIIIGGVRYTTSNGDSSAIKGAKDTILYSVVGLVVAILAYAIVNFILGAFK
jgi:hypothetical protein